MESNLNHNHQKTGVIGLGAMGQGMALNLHKAGHLHAVWNRTTAKAEQFARETGAALADSPRALAEACDVIITCVSRDPDVIEVIEALAAGIRPGAIVIDTSTVSGATAQKAAAILTKKQAAFLDAPVSGGVEGARNGTLVMMVGGDESILNKARPVLSSIASNIVHIGPTGSGQNCKAVNQLLCAGINQAVTESLAFGQALKLDMDKVIDVLCGGAAGNWFLAHRGRTMLAGKFAPGFKVNLHYKDLAIIQEMINRLRGAAMPLGEMTLEHYRRLMEQGYGDEDISALYRLKTPK
jgi:3-hydroxyisobutyrate dehydrogenase